MKVKFKTQDFQTAAVNAVVDLFKGQEKRCGTFTITNETQGNFDNLGYTKTEYIRRQFILNHGAKEQRAADVEG